MARASKARPSKQEGLLLGFSLRGHLKSCLLAGKEASANLLPLPKIELQHKQVLRPTVLDNIYRGSFELRVDCNFFYFLLASICLVSSKVGFSTSRLYKIPRILSRVPDS